MNKISIIGLGYVGLPLAVEFSKKFDVVGFDISKDRINQLNKNKDITNELSYQDLKKSKKIIYTNNELLLADSNIYIVTVPTPVTKKNIPDLRPIKSATKLISKFISKKDIIIYESTVFPGFTEEVCVPLIEKITKFSHNKDFFTGYSPERINPGDKKRNLLNIRKITSGSNKLTSIFIDNLYKKIITAGTYRVSSIKVAESAKVIENMQRDVNIAFMNQLSFFFNKLNINTKEVLNAASTKWNFLNFKPGLVGGHCVSVDPYYYIFKSNQLNVDSTIFSTARKINNSVPAHIVKKIIYEMKKNYIPIKKSKLLILGVSFKENCSDIRNSLVFNIYDFLKDKDIMVDLYDPIVSNNINDISKKYSLIKYPKTNYYDVIFMAVNHKFFCKIGNKKIFSFGKKNHIFFDLFNSNMKKNIYSIL